MQRTIRRLTAREVAYAKPDTGRSAVMLPDGGNLYLQASRDRAHPDRIHRSWVFRYELDGHRHDMGLGPLHTLDLADARVKAKTLRQQLLDGIDPLAIRQQQKRDRLEALAAQQRAMTFRQCAEACIASHESGWTNATHRQQWHATLEQYAYPVLGDMAVDDISTPHIVRVLEPIWKEIPETASRVRGRIEKVLGWAAVRGFRSGDNNPARWRGHLAELFPAKGKVSATKHLAALPFSDVPAFMVELRQRDTLVARALEFVVLTAGRRSEVTGATWPEIDLKARTWTIPASRMKAKKEHRVPLCDRAVAILSALPRSAERSARVFPLSDRAMTDLLQDMRPGFTTHGFRSSFRDWAAERTNYPNIVVEAALAHAIPDRVEAAYRRGDLLEKRRRLMADWAAWCARPVPAGATVTPIARVR
jgi:integrase